MAFAVHLFFDADTEAAIKEAWKKLADTEIGVIEFRPVKHLFGFRLGEYN